MEFKVGVGKSDFAALRRDGDCYVDKTELIYELLEENNNQVTLFTRPRRFGKTLMMSMMANFFDIRKESKDIFEGLAVTRHTDFCRKWMNQYPVLLISFKDIEAKHFSEAYDMLKFRLADVCKKFSDLAEQEAVDEDDRDIFLRLKSQKGTYADIKNALKLLMRMMYAVYGREVILLMDEYDVPLARAREEETQEKGFYASMLDLIRGIMGTALKDNEYLKFAVVTGCLRIAKESLFTGTNNFVSYSVLDEDFSSYFGFSAEEVREMLAAAGRSDKSDIMKQWYDGYIFGNSRLYCPWDVMNYMAALKKREDAKPQNYWKNTSHNGILLSFVGRTDFSVADKFENLMNGEPIIQTISDELTYDTLYESEENLWSVLLMTGYVTKSDTSEGGEAISLKIPNQEIASIFQDAVSVHFKNTMDGTALRLLMDCLWNGDEAVASQQLSELLWNTISYNDYHEDYYHAFLAGTFIGRGYEVESNKEHGLGRPDILLKDKENRRAIIIEAKRSSSESAMDKDCDKAIHQIQAAKYAKGLNGYEQILCYGVAFFQKCAKVKRMRQP